METNWVGIAKQGTKDTGNPEKSPLWNELEKPTH